MKFMAEISVHFPRARCVAGVLMSVAVLFPNVRAQDEVWRGTVFREFHRVLDNPGDPLPFGWGISVLPTGYVNFGHTGFAYADLFVPDGDSVRLDVANAIEQMRPINRLYLDAVPIEFLVAVRPAGLRNHQFFAGYRLGLWTRITYSRDLWEVAWYGNYPYAGQTKQLLLRPNILLFNQFLLGYAFIQKKWSAGVRLTLTSGVFALRTTRADGTLYTASDYDTVWLRLDYEIYGGVIGEPPRDTAGNVQITPDYLRSQVFALRNMGISVDLGGTYQVNDQLTVMAVVRNLGVVPVRPVNGYTSVVRIQADTPYAGLNIRELITFDTTIAQQLGALDTLRFQPIEDTLKKKVRFSSDTMVPFRMNLPVRVLVGGRYRLSDYMEAWVTAGGEIFQGFHPQVVLGISRQVTGWFQVGVYYNYKNRHPLNLGAYLLFRFRPFHLTVVSDNLPALFTPKRARSFHLRVSGYLYFEKDVKEQEVRY